MTTARVDNTQELAGRADAFASPRFVDDYAVAVGEVLWRVMAGYAEPIAVRAGRQRAGAARWDEDGEQIFLGVTHFRQHDRNGAFDALLELTEDAIRRHDAEMRRLSKQVALIHRRRQQGRRRG